MSILSKVVLAVLSGMLLLNYASFGRCGEDDALSARSATCSQYLDQLEAPPKTSLDALVYLSRLEADCIVHLIYDSKKSPALSFQFMKGGRELLTIPGHFQSAFAAKADKLYFVRFSTASSGATVISYDLATGKKLWETKLKAAGNVSHFSYSNIVNITLTGDDNLPGGDIVIEGHETAGTYVEVLDQATGKLLAHRLFKSVESNAAGDKGK